MNNNPKPTAGTYRTILPLALALIGRETEAKLFANGTIKLGIASTFTGNVNTYPNLTPICIEGLKAMQLIDTNTAIPFYIYELEHGNYVPCGTAGAYVYDQNDPVAIDYVNSRLKEDNDRLIHPFFTS